MTKFLGRASRVKQHPIYLDEHQVSRRWMDEDLRFASIIQTMEAVEDWVIKSQRVEEKSKSLWSKMEAVASSKFVGQSGEEIIFLLAYMKLGRAMHVLSALDTKYNGAGLKLIQHAISSIEEEGEDSQPREGLLMVERLDVLRRFNQLGKVFSTPRLRFVAEALKEVERNSEKDRE